MGFNEILRFVNINGRDYQVSEHSYYVIRQLESMAEVFGVRVKLERPTIDPGIVMLFEVPTTHGRHKQYGIRVTDDSVALPQDRVKAITQFVTIFHNNAMGIKEFEFNERLGSFITKL